jgi:hypothetical protein
VSADGVRDNEPPDSRAASSSALEGVLHVLAGLLEIALGLIHVALGLHVTVPRGPTDALLALAGQRLKLVLDLVRRTHNDLRFVSVNTTSGGVC